MVYSFKDGLIFIFLISKTNECLIFKRFDKNERKNVINVDRQRKHRARKAGFINIYNSSLICDSRYHHTTMHNFQG